MTAMRTPFSADQKPSFAPRAGKGVIALSGVSKMFGPTLANVDVCLHIARGDVLGLVGGNGAGKSTLMRILCGVFRPDTGTLSVDGTVLALEDFDAKAAQGLGIRIVHQELSLCSNLTVAENFFLEAPQAAHCRPGWREVYRQRARAALDAVFPGNGINVHKKVEGLPIGERQMVEIARAVATPGVRLIILDEPTSSLGLERSRQLRAYIHDKAAAGLSFIFISHKLFEVIDVANAVAVLRNGRLVWHGEARDVAVHDLVTMMGGAVQPVAARREVGATGEAAVRIKGDVAALIGHEVALRRGEIVGVAGLEGSGQKELLHRLFAPGRGDAVTLERTGKASFVSGDRQKEGVFPLWTVLANIGLGRVAQRPSLALVSDAAERDAMRPMTDRLQLDAARLKFGILDLSGGNQQKALVARALVTDAPIVLLDDPTRGVDVAAKRDFYALAREMAQAGRLVVWYSTEDLEFLQCDRVLVFAHGRIVRELVREEISEKAIVDSSFTPAVTADAGSGALKAAGVDGAPSWTDRLVDAAPFATLAFVLAAMVLANPATASVFGLDLLLSPAIPLVLVALAQMFIVGGSEIDLGIGAFAGLINVISATWLFDMPAYGSLALAGIMLLYPLLGFLIQARRIPAIVVTLGASFVWMGIAYTMQPTPGGSSPDWLTALVSWSVPGVPTSLIILLLAGLVALAIDRTPLGVVLRAFGNNPVAMQRCGWSAERYGALRYFLAGLFGIAAGLSLTAINTASDYNSGGTYTLLSVAAVMIGGCSLMGGSISALGVVAGSVTLALIGALLGMMNVPSDFTAAVQGVLLLVILGMRAAVAGGREEE